MWSIIQNIISKRFEDPLLLYQVCPLWVPFSISCGSKGGFVIGDLVWSLLWFVWILLGKKRRVQFVECPNDINGMIDAAKFADLALLLIDGSYGFEMVRYLDRDVWFFSLSSPFDTMDRQKFLGVKCCSFNWQLGLI